MSDQEETSLLDDLGAAWDEIDEETPDVENQQSEPAEAEPELDTSGGSESESGDTEVEAVVPEPVEAGAEGSEEPADSEVAPVGLSPQAREDWKNTPESVRKDIAKREADFEKGIEKHRVGSQRAAAMDRVFQPYQQLFAMNGGAGQVLPGLLQTASLLQMGSPQQKAASAASLIKQFGVDINVLDQILVGETPQPSQNDQVQQLVDQRMQAYQQQHQQAEAQKTQAQIGTEVQAFAQDPKNEFYRDVSNDMADLMDMAANRGQQMSMQQAYDKAVQMHPQISQIIKARETQPNIASKKKAASSIHGLQGGPGGHSAPDSTRAALEDAWDNAGQM